MRLRRGPLRTRPAPARPALSRLALAAAVLGLASTLLADVFWRRPRTADALLADLGGTRLYATDVLLNGQPGALAAFAFRDEAATVGTRLAQRLGLPRPDGRGGLCLTAVERGQVRRLLVLPAAQNADACLVFALEQARGPAASALRRPDGWPPGVPALAATPLFSAVCAQTRTAFVAAETASAPDQAALEAAQTLRAAGWTETGPSSPAFKLFSSGRTLCAVLACRQADSGRTLLSLVQREGAAP